MTDPISTGELIALTVMLTLGGAMLVAGLTIAAVLWILDRRRRELP